MIKKFLFKGFAVLAACLFALIFADPVTMAILPHGMEMAIRAYASSNNQAFEHGSTYMLAWLVISYAGIFIILMAADILAFCVTRYIAAWRRRLHHAT